MSGSQSYKFAPLHLDQIHSYSWWSFQLTPNLGLQMGIRLSKYSKPLLPTNTGLKPIFASEKIWIHILNYAYRVQNIRISGHMKIITSYIKIYIGFKVLYSLSYRLIFEGPLNFNHIYHLFILFFV